jgi:hypothetical protein
MKYEESLAAFKEGFMDGDASLNMAISLVRLGRTDEARAQVSFIFLEAWQPK